MHSSKHLILNAFSYNVPPCTKKANLPVLMAIAILIKRH